MQTDLWSFALATYAEPGVEPACLALQHDGTDICLLLCALWLGNRGVAWQSGRSSALEQLCQPWRDKVIAPLRGLRQQWREPARQDAELRGLRERVKALELEAEHTLLLRLQACAQDWPCSDESQSERWINAVLPERARSNHAAQQVLRGMISQP